MSYPDLNLVCINDLPHETLFESAKRCQAWLENSNLKIHSENRFSQLCRAVTCPSEEIILQDHPRFEAARQSIQDLQEMCFIIETFNDELLKDLKSKFMKTLKDSPVPDKDTKQTEGRDTQLELFIGSIFKRAGMEPSLGGCGMADWMVNTLAFRLAVEVKRCKTVSGIEDNVKKAAKQIKLSRRGGVIILDTTQAFNPKHEHIKKPVDDEQIMDAHDKLINYAMKNDLKNICDWVDGKDVGMIYLHNKVIRPGFQNPDLGINCSAYSLWCKIDTKRWAKTAGNPFHEFSNLFTTAQPRM